MLLKTVISWVQFYIFYIVFQLFRKKNEEDALRKKKENNDKFYEPEPEPQAMIDSIMENMSRRMLDFDRKQPSSISKQQLSQDINKFIDRDKKKEILISNVGCELEGLEKIDELMNITVVNMDSVVSDLNSFLASTRRAMSSPAQQKRNASLPGFQSSKISSVSQNKSGSLSGSQPAINSYSGSECNISLTGSQDQINSSSIGQGKIVSLNRTQLSSRVSGNSSLDSNHNTQSLNSSTSAAGKDGNSSGHIEQVTSLSSGSVKPATRITSGPTTSGLNPTKQGLLNKENISRIRFKLFLFPSQRIYKIHFYFHLTIDLIF